MKKYLFALGLITAVLCITLFGCGDENADPKEESSQTETQAQVTESTTEDPLTLNPALMDIATEYGDLRYPKRWDDQLRTEVLEKDGISTVEMYATVGEHEELHIYDVLFGGDVGTCIGAVNAGGEKVYVNLVSYDLDLNDWSEEDRLTLLAMKEDINYLIDELN